MTSALDKEHGISLVALDAQVLDRDGAKLRLSSGMQVITELHQDERSVLEHLLSSVQKMVHEAGRER